MKALRIEGVQQARLTDIPLPEPGPGMVRLQVRHVGLCGSDLNTYLGRNPLVSLPRVPGHEIGGIIDTIGADVPGTLRAGMTALVLPYTTCGVCPACRVGRTNACRDNRTLGVQQEGGLSEAIVLPHDRLIPEDRLAAPALALVEPLAVGFHAVARAQPQPGEWVAVVGCGMIGMGALIAAVDCGARAIAIDLSAAKLDVARQLGATAVVQAGTDDVAEAVSALTDGDGVAVALEAVGRPETFRQVVELTAPAGRVVFVGYSKAPVSFDTSLFNLRELDLFGSRNATRRDFAAAADWLAAHASQAEGLISRVFPMAEAEAALPWWVANPDSLKVLVEVSA